jgi:hypothetical protein
MDAKLAKENEELRILLDNGNSKKTDLYLLNKKLTETKLELNGLAIKISEANNTLNQVLTKVGFINNKSDYLQGQEAYIKTQFEKIGLPYQQYEQ